ncbi:beta-ketoacyl-[acyl-carrier-protein] synthase family protein [Caballeronia sp. LjRoot29]|uniref:beta-ketoacyl-[acyl-carrier-protein] synthase family protein n=1 Tax=Caballeronia sp. LjRoot29 TaxID=3342315 RepID=UPI003ED0E57A
MRRVAVTGVGAICPLGTNATETFGSASMGASGIHRLDTAFSGRLLSPIVATAELMGELHFPPPKLRMLDRVSQFALVAAKEAFAAALIDEMNIDSFRSGVFVGTGMGGTHTIDEGYQTLYGENSNRIKPFTVLMGMYNAPAAWISMEHGLKGPSLTYSTACASSAVAIGEAWMRVAHGELDLAIAGGAEAPLSSGSLKAWEALHTIAAIDANDPASSCKPFSKNRSGMVLGEGAAMVVLEPWETAVDRGASIYGEILGYGIATDIGHITRPNVEGQVSAMRHALSVAEIDISDVDAINAHGTGTVANDATETAAIKVVFGAGAHRIPISATKSMHGHLLGAAGALECVLSFLAMQSKILLPTMHLYAADPECDLDYVPNHVRERKALRIMLSNSFAFGGTNAVLVLKCRD